MAGLTILLSGCAATEPVERLSAACPLLANPQAGFYLESGLVVTEGPQQSDTPVYACEYRRGNEIVFGFSVTEVPARGQTPTTLINSIARRARARTTNIDGLGDAAVYYELQRRRFAVLTVAKQSDANIRVIALNGQMPFSQTRLSALASIVLRQV